MIKRFVILLCLMFLSISLVQAGSIGISPAKFSFFFEPNMHKELNFRILTDNPNQSVGAYVRGDLAEYVSLSKTNLTGSGSLEVNLSLPNYIEKPGTHQILIGAIEVREDAGTVGGAAAIQALIEIIVPYPGKYIEADFNIKNVNEGEDIYFDISVSNLGKEDVQLGATIDLHEEESKTKITTKTIQKQSIASKENLVITDFIDGSDIKAGSYIANLTLEYGSSHALNINETIRVGQFFVDILDYDHIFETKKINPFSISVENVWNKKMNNVFAEVSVTDQGIVVDTFKTPSINLNAWQLANMTGYFDATKLEAGKYTANIKVTYENDSNYKLVAIYTVDKKLDMKWYIIGVGAAFVLVLIFITLIYLVVKVRGLKKHETKKKK